MTASGCGHTASPPTTNTITPGTYTISVTATATGGTPTHSGTYTVTIQ